MPPRFGRLPIVGLLFATACSCARANAQLIFSEFLASNTLAMPAPSQNEDEDGDKEDWIEIANISSTPVDLLGWYLTDDMTKPRQWALPSRILGAGAYLRIFASGKDRKPASGNLHTNFKLSDNGEYLGLFKDIAGGGVQVVQAFDPYPRQAANISYGTAATTTTTSLVASGASVKVFVPTSGNGGSTLGTTWAGAAVNEPFDDSTWAAGTWP